MNKKVFYIVTGIVSIISVVWFYFSPTIGEIIELNKLNNKVLTTFNVEWNTVTMNNEINSKTLGQLKKVFEENPKIDTLVMWNVPGSIDDDANLKTAEWISKKNLTFILNSDSEIASWWTDFFLAWKNRVIYDWAKVWVHSWWTPFDQAKDFPKWHEYHLPYIEYYKKIWMTQKESEDFYYFTINAAPIKDIYWMTNEELIKYWFTKEIKK